jgi:hypothetical protein
MKIKTTLPELLEHRKGSAKMKTDSAACLHKRIEKFQVNNLMMHLNLMEK